MEQRKPQYTVTPQMHALRRAMELSRIATEREEKRKELRKKLKRQSEDRFLFRNGVAADDPRYPMVHKALIEAGMRGMDIADENVSHEVSAKVLAAHERTLSREDTDVIYYVQVGDLIKLGTTNNLTRRMRAYPPNAVVLATETGSYLRETQRVEQFAEYLAGRREWFHPGPRLLAHIEELRAAIDAA